VVDEKAFPYCRDCKHIRNAAGGEWREGQFTHCGLSRVGIAALLGCHTARGQDGPCGPMAKLFEMK
jgi:hypothetical protein